jgi:hypothetical protein
VTYNRPKAAIKTAKQPPVGGLEQDSSGKSTLFVKPGARAGTRALAVFNPARRKSDLTVVRDPAPPALQVPRHVPRDIPCHIPCHIPCAGPRHIPGAIAGLDPVAEQARPRVLDFFLSSHLGDALCVTALPAQIRSAGGEKPSVVSHSSTRAVFAHNPHIAGFTNQRGPRLYDLMKGNGHMIQRLQRVGWVESIPQTHHWHQRQTR